MFSKQAVEASFQKIHRKKVFLPFILHDHTMNDKRRDLLWQSSLYLPTLQQLLGLQFYLHCQCVSLTFGFLEQMKRVISGFHRGDDFIIGQERTLKHKHTHILLSTYLSVL